MKNMYILEMIEDCGYDGVYTTSIVVSENEEKLKDLSLTLKDNLLQISSKMNEFKLMQDEKYKSLRVKCLRTNEEIIEFNNFVKELKLLYIDVEEYNLFEYYFSVSDISFEVKKIKHI